MFREDQKRSNRKYRKTLQGDNFSGFTVLLVKKDFRAEIYYQTMNVVTLKQDPKYNVG